MALKTKIARRKLLTYTEPATIDCTFEEFFVIWAHNCERTAWLIPKLHFEIIKFLSRFDAWTNLTALLQIFRGASKSTIVGLYISYLLAKNPSLRFLILSADGDKADKITRHVKDIIMRHPLCSHLIPHEDDITAQWRADSFFVQGSNDARTPSLSSYGILSNVTSARADFLIFDDVEVPKNCDTEDKREELRLKIAETSHILVPGGHTLYIGTPHHADTVYKQIEELNISVLKIPLLSNITGEWPMMVGDSSWPDKFNTDEIFNRQKKSLTKNNFLANYQLTAISNVDTRLKHENLLRLHVQQGFDKEIIINGEMIHTISAYWDVSSGQEGRDDSILAVVGKNRITAQVYVLKIAKLVGGIHEQIELIHPILFPYNLRRCNIESNSIGTFVPEIFRKRYGTHIVANGVNVSSNKNLRIIQAFDEPLASHLLYCDSASYHLVKAQLENFNPNSRRNKDDILDAITGALGTQQPYVNESLLKSNVYDVQLAPYRFSS